LPVLVAVMAACDVTDLSPVNVIPEGLAFDTKANCESAMIGVYDAAQSGFYNNDETNDRGYIFGAAHVQQGDMRGEDFTLVNVFFDNTFRATWTVSTANQTNYWENGWRIINLANLVMEGVAGAAEKGVLTAAEAAAYQGEARVIRAMTYHTLLIHFARPYRDGAGASPGLPLLTKGVNTGTKAGDVILEHRATVAQVYAQILDDLNFAETNLPAPAQAKMTVTRATKGAAIALKTRVYLHMGDWAKTIAEGQKLVAADPTATGPISEFKLGTTPDAPWSNNKSSESILSMEMSATDDLNTNSALARMLGTPAKGARGEYLISPIIWNKDFWNADDLRRTAQFVLPSADGNYYYINKFRDYTQWTDFVPVIRYAEVILNLAEAQSRTTDLSADALKNLNAIRNRAIPAGSLSMTPYVMGNFADGKALTQAILNERRIELLGEGERWSDIHRNAVDPDFKNEGIPAKMNYAQVLGNYGIGKAVTPGVKAIPYTDYRYVWPIPLTETTRNPVLAVEQNPNY